MSEVDLCKNWTDVKTLTDINTELVLIYAIFISTLFEDSRENQRVLFLEAFAGC